MQMTAAPVRAACLSKIAAIAAAVVLSFLAARHAGADAGFRDAERAAPPSYRSSTAVSQYLRPATFRRETRMQSPAAAGHRRPARHDSHHHPIPPAAVRTAHLHRATRSNHADRRERLSAPFISTGRSRGQAILEYVLVILVVSLVVLYVVRPLGRSIRCSFLQATAAATGESPPGLEECSFEESLLAKAPEEFRSTSLLMAPLQVGGAAVTRELPVRTSTPPPAAAPPPPVPPPTPSWPPSCLGCHKFQPLGPSDCGPMPYHWVSTRLDVCPKGCCVMTWRR